MAADGPPKIENAVVPKNTVDALHPEAVPCKSLKPFSLGGPCLGHIIILSRVSENLRVAHLCPRRRACCPVEPTP